MLLVTPITKHVVEEGHEMTFTDLGPAGRVSTVQLAPPSVVTTTFGVAGLTESSEPVA